MMGRQVEQAALFYEVRLEDRVPRDHLLRRIDALLDLGLSTRRWRRITARRGAPRSIPC
jgi:hypothetical protein